MTIPPNRLIFVHGKGGVGKTAVSQALALSWARTGKRVLWTTFEDPSLPANVRQEIEPGLFHLNCTAQDSFEEYMELKLGGFKIAKLFSQNKLIRYLSQAAPGIPELVLLGKVWFERTRYDAVIVDMPSTGYGITMFQSTANFTRLFTGGPLHSDSLLMLESFRNPGETAHVIVGLPEETPLRESLDLRDFLAGVFPGNPPIFWVNRLYPKIAFGPIEDALDPKASPISETAEAYLKRRAALEDHNLRIWRDADVRFGEIPFFATTHANELSESIAKVLASGTAGDA